MKAKRVQPKSPRQGPSTLYDQMTSKYDYFMPGWEREETQGGDEVPNKIDMHYVLFGAWVGDGKGEAGWEGTAFTPFWKKFHDLHMHLLQMCYILKASNFETGRKCLRRSVNVRMLVRREKLFNWMNTCFQIPQQIACWSSSLSESLPGDWGSPECWIQGAMLHMFSHTQTWPNKRESICIQDTRKGKHEREKRRYFELKAKEEDAKRAADEALARSAQLFARWNAIDPAGPPSAACVDSTTAMNSYVQRCLNRRSDAYNKRREQQKKVLKLKEKRSWVYSMLVFAAHNTHILIYI